MCSQTLHIKEEWASGLGGGMLHPSVLVVRGTAVLISNMRENTVAYRKNLKKTQEE